MTDVLDPAMTLTPEQRADVEANVAKAHEVARWLESLGPVGRRRDVGALAADLSDLYVAAVKYRRQLDALLALGPHDRIDAADTAIDVVTELRHMAWHIRSVAPRLDRLAVALDPEDDEDADETGDGSPAPGHADAAGAASANGSTHRDPVDAATT